MNTRRFIECSARVLVILAVAGCAAKPQAHPADQHAVHWSYTGSTGPAHWGSLSPEYALCSTGRSQSPIDIATTSPRDLNNIVFSYQPTPLNIVNNGHTVQVNYAQGSFIEIDGERFDLAQFHFHAPSEHTLNGVHADMEMHLVHKSAKGRLAVVGVMIRRGTPNPMFDALARNIPTSGQKVERPEVMINAAAFLPADQRTYRYDGSLTTPPGTEGVKWSMMIQPMTLSAEQIAAFTSHYNANRRPVQLLNGRQVVEDTSR
jgi:carbonic anhydrase